VFLLLLCNDREVLGPWVNARWLNLLASGIIAILLLLSGILMATTLFPHLDVTRVGELLAVGMLVVGAAAAGVLRFSGGRRPDRPAAGSLSEPDKLNWRMPQLALLRPVAWSPGLKLGMLALRGYLIASAVLLTVKAVQLGGG
jgi:hypothetical protein